MIENPCLRPACLSDIPHATFYECRTVNYVGQVTASPVGRDEAVKIQNPYLAKLYEAEWKLRGFERSP